MSQNPKEEPFSETNLNSPEYRERLMKKLNALIAVLEVATAKVRRSLAGPDPDVERLTRIRNNLQSTLEVCLRARSALERREALPKELPENLNQIIKDSGMAGARADHLTPPEPVLDAARRGRRDELDGREEALRAPGRDRPRLDRRRRHRTSSTRREQLPASVLFQKFVCTMHVSRHPCRRCTS